MSPADSMEEADEVICVDITWLDENAYPGDLIESVKTGLTYMVLDSCVYHGTELLTPDATVVRGFLKIVNYEIRAGMQAGDVCCFWYCQETNRRRRLCKAL